jgi:hypothetical protein
VLKNDAVARDRLLLIAAYLEEVNDLESSYKQEVNAVLSETYTAIRLLDGEVTGTEKTRKQKRQDKRS